MLHARTPIPALAPFVGRLWATDAAGSSSHGAPAERVLPSGSTHLVLRLGSDPLRIHEDGDTARATKLGSALVGGVRMAAYFKDVSRPVPTVGAVLEPGAASLLFAVPADELAGRHTPLDALWGAEADLWCQELAEIGTLEGRLACLERHLRQRLPAVRGLHPGVARALRSLAPRGPEVGPASVGRAAEESGLSHRRFGQLFREAAGLSPKRWARLRRFQRAVQRVAAEPRVSWADVALELGYSDQPHLTREFREFAGLSPGEYRRLAPRSPNHVPLPGEPFPSRPGRRAG